MNRVGAYGQTIAWIIDPSVNLAADDNPLPTLREGRVTGPAGARMAAVTLDTSTRKISYVVAKGDLAVPGNYTVSAEIVLSPSHVVHSVRSFVVYS